MAFQIVTDLATMDELHAEGLLYVNAAMHREGATWNKDADDDPPSEFLEGATLRKDGVWVREHTRENGAGFFTYHAFGISVED